MACNKKSPNHMTQSRLVALIDPLKSYKNGIGGQERFAIRLAENLAGDFRVTFYTNNIEPLAARHKGNKLNRICLKRIRLINLFSPRFELSADILIANGERALLYAVLARLLKQTSARIIYIAHIFIPDAISRKSLPLRSIYIAAYRILLAKIDRNVCVSESLRKQLASRNLNGKQEWEVVVNGVKSRDVSGRNDRLPENREKLKLLFAGRLCKQKGIVPFIETFYRSGAPEVANLAIAGTGPEERAIRESVDQFKLRNQVTLLGYCHDLPEKMLECDIVVLPSLYEGLPLVLLEAMSLGKVVLASNIEPHKEVLQSRFSNLLLTNGDASELMKALRDLSNAPKRKGIGRALQRHQQQYFDESTMWGKYKQIIRSLEG